MRTTANQIKRLFDRERAHDCSALYRELDLRRRRAQIAARHALMDEPPRPVDHAALHASAARISRVA